MIIPCMNDKQIFNKIQLLHITMYYKVKQTRKIFFMNSNTATVNCEQYTATVHEQCRE